MPEMSVGIKNVKRPKEELTEVEKFSKEAFSTVKVSKEALTSASGASNLVRFK